MHYYGYWSLPENVDKAEQINQLQKVGVSDYYAKAINGYTSLSWMGLHIEYLEDSNLIYFIETMKSVGLLDEAMFHDSFLYTDARPMEQNWNMSGTWNVKNGTIIPYNIKDVSWSTALEGSTGMDPTETIVETASETAFAFTKSIFNNVNYQVWVKGNGETGIAARVVDQDNYYLLSYDGTKAAIKKKVNGEYSELTSKEISLDTKEAHRFRGVLDGNRITFYIDGTFCFGMYG